MSPDVSDLAPPRGSRSALDGPGPPHTHTCTPKDTQSLSTDGPAGRLGSGWGAHTAPPH